MKLSLKYTMGLVLLACSMLPVYLAGQLILNKQNQSSLEQKETKLDNSTTGIRQTVQEQIKLTASLTQWYSQDRSLIKAGGNIFFSSVVWDKMDSFNALAESVSATYILDQNWKPIYDSKGSLYHFEQSQLLESLKRPQSVYGQGKLFHTEFTETEVADNATAGIAFVAPILPYRLIEGSTYTPQGYLVVLMGYDRLNTKVTPFLYQNESVEFNYVDSTDAQSSEQSANIISIDSKFFTDKLVLNVKHHISDSARLLEMQQAQVVFVRILVATLAIAIVFALFLSRWFSGQLNLLAESVKSYSHNQSPTHSVDEHRFTEFVTLSRLLETMWGRIQYQVRELTESNDKLERFNVQLEDLVEEKTSKLTYSLAREESQKHRILKIVQFASSRQAAEYRLIPQMVDQELKALLAQHSIQFHFNRTGEADLILCDSQETAIGYFCATSFALLSEEDLLIFDMYQKQLAGWLELENITRINMSTGCLNRKAFNEDLEFSKRSINDNQNQISLIIIDINGLKTTNDVHGHEVGDELIQRCVDVISHELTPASNLYRLGGDEFAVLTLTSGESNSLNVAEMAEQLHIAQKQQTIETKTGISIPVRFSIGAASSDSTDVEQLFSVADENMYQQKRRYYQTLSVVGK
ncbi:putative ggdef protein [Vibrio coralliirubri]|nr:putative ggdef protein [Vibrio coralliirubri]CDT83349.1 putative ggdef protein [Vibrio coralliirubri]